jgi:hypothetical protein
LNGDLGLWFVDYLSILSLVCGLYIAARASSKLGDKLRKESVCSHQFCIGALFGDLPVGQRDNVVDMREKVEFVGNKDPGPAVERTAGAEDVVKDGLSYMSVESGEGVVE